MYQKATSHLTDHGLGMVAEAHRAGTVQATSLAAGFERTVLDRWVTTIRDREPVLRTFHGSVHHESVERFVQLDRAHIELSRQHVVRSLEQRLPTPGASGASAEQGIVERELRKKTRHMAIRKLLQSIPALLPSIKPCLLMSPLSVAQYLPADGRRFDLVVFDEASQIGTQDAIGAIARGNQVVIVGDSKQLPPTSFFMRASVGDDALADENDVEELESILEEALARQLPQQMLGWHYRSRHDALIDFSNRHYYAGRLNVFPAARQHVPELGVKLHSVPDGVYISGDKGKFARTNPKEAEALVNYLVEALGTREPQDRSFGVVTFSMAQQGLIQDLLDERRAQLPELEKHFSGPEAVFVKNLENVQGDERDEILFSIGYARDERGRLRMHFGPLSISGGERRLNVAITRARCQLRVFSTLTFDQIDTARTSSVGATHLRDFLEYAARHGQQAPAARAAEHESPSQFESTLQRALTALGYKVDAQVGCGGYRIDLAIAHPTQPGVYVLGVECDGPNYHAAKTARDRDRLRRQVLESLGWRMLRVWSTDLGFNQQAEIERIQTAVRAALGASA
jgi:very-short-patch-repair endonuclease